MLGEKVKHIKFGEGIVEEVDKNIVKVLFNLTGDIKPFSYPKSFEKFIFFENQMYQEQVKADIEAESQKENTLKKEREFERQKIQSKKKESKVSRGNTKKSSFKAVIKGNIAMKCTFCDGGSSDSSLGFSDVCSVENISNNIKQGRVNCNGSDCRKFYDEEITYKELLERNRNGGFLCYDSAFLRDWKVYAGFYHNGDDKGKPMKFRNVANNKLTVLTTLIPGSQERERIVFGVYIIKDYFEGDNLEEGYIDSKEDYRLELTPKEAEEIKFWKYYYNEKSPKRIQFGSGLHRYLTNEQAVQILKDIVAVKKGTKDEEISNELLGYYLKINGLELNTIGEAIGPLVGK